MEFELGDIVVVGKQFSNRRRDLIGEVAYARENDNYVIEFTIEVTSRTHNSHHMIVLNKHMRKATEEERFMYLTYGSEGIRQ